MWWKLRDKLKPYKFDVAVDVQGRLITGLVLLCIRMHLFAFGLGGTKELKLAVYKLQSKAKYDHVIKQYIEVAELTEILPLQ